jgi:DNA-binding transcriptional LysR family regulator
LEKQIGVRLLNRTTRSVSLTEPGARYLEACKRILGEIADQDALMSGMRDSAAGDLSVISPKWVGSLDLGDAIASFAVEHPLIRVRLELGGLSERSYAFVKDGYDIAFHTQNPGGSSVMVKKIASLHFVLCAAPGYLARKGRADSPTDLTQHDCLVHLSDPVWHFMRGQARHSYKPQQIVFSSNTYLVLQKAAIRGMGLAMLPFRSIYPQVKAGHLQVVLPHFPTPERPLYAVYAPGRQVIRKVSIFVDFIAEWFNQHPRGAGARRPRD